MAYSTVILADSPTQYLRLGESSGATAQDATANNFDGTYTGAVITYSQTGLLSGDADTCVDLDGTNAYVACGNSVATNAAFSAECWVVMDDVTARGIITKGTASGGNQSQREVDIQGNASGNLQVVFSDGTTYLMTLDTGFALSTATTYHIVVTWDGTTNANGVKVYVNGSLVAQGTTTASPANTRNWNCGGISTNSLDGRIDEFALYTSVLTSTQVSDHYDAGTVSANSVSITNPVQYRTYQRNGSSQAGITANGGYGGTPTAIEARFNGGSWATIDAAPAGGTWSGTLSAQAAGTGTFEVRFTNDTATTDSVADIRIGDVFAWFGQSNRGGRFTSGQAFTGAVACSIYDEAAAWSNLASNYKDPDESTFSVLPLLASLIVTHTGFPAAFICQSAGSTGLVSPDANWSTGGTQFTAAMGRIASSSVNAVALILYLQGERDANNGIDTATYAAALSTMLNDMQAAQAALAGVKLQASNIGENSGATQADLSDIQQAIITAWDADADIVPGATAHDQNFSDDLHWTSDAQAIVLAGREWRAIKANIFSGTEDARGPRFSWASFSGAVVTIRLTGGVSPLVNGTVTTGWEVTDGAGARTVSSASSAGLIVTLTCSQALVAPVTVSYGRGNQAVGTTTVDSGTIKAAPIESFVNQSVVQTNVSRQFRVVAHQQAVTRGSRI